MLIERWRRYYNTLRPHSSLGYQLPAPETWTEGRPDPAFVTHGLASGKLYEPDVSFVLLRVLIAGDSVADVGGHVGYFSLLSAALVGPTGQVLTFELKPGKLQAFKGEHKR